jgi:hypothetical protein
MSLDEQEIRGCSRTSAPSKDALAPASSSGKPAYNATKSQILPIIWPYYSLSAGSVAFFFKR